MTTESIGERLSRRIADLWSNDEQFAAAAPDEAVAAELTRPELRLPDVVRTVMTSYAGRPALAQRAVREVTDIETGRTTLQLLPRYETISYRQLWSRVQALTSAWHVAGIEAGDRVAILGFNSAEYTVVDTALTQLGAVSVPLQTSAPAAQLQPIVAETEPVVIATSVDFISDAVELALSGAAPRRIVVFDYHPAVDAEREALDAATQLLSEANRAVIIETLGDVLARGAALEPVAPVIPDGENPLYLLIYTSGSTGTPKGAMYPESAVTRLWSSPLVFDWAGQAKQMPAITLNFMPMSHVFGRAILINTLSAGGTAYFTARSDLSTLLEDLALTRPTHLSFVPRIWEILFQEYQSRVNRRARDRTDPGTAENEVLDEIRYQVLGGRYVAVITSSAPTSRELLHWVENLTQLQVVDGYGSTESGPVLVDGHVKRPPVIDYRLADVPDLGYFRTDLPHPRGELLVKSESMFPGYYKRPELTAEVFDEDGYYRTGDIVTELGPDHLQYVDRRNFVLKLSQGEFIAVSKLETAFVTSPLINQIYVYGDSARAYLLAVIVPTEHALTNYDGPALETALTDALQAAGRNAGLRSYEIPRAFVVETTPFTLENGLLTGIRKLARPRLKERYGPALQELYTILAEGQEEELRVLHHSGADRPTLETISRAAATVLGASANDLQPDTHFTDVGGDSLSALTFANLLRDIFDIDVPVAMIVSPTSDLQSLADYVEAEQKGSKRPTFASVHGRDASKVDVRDLALDKFLDTATLSDASSVHDSSSEIRTVLLTGATGFLGRYLALEWLERMDLVGGKVICLVRAKSDEEARRRLDKIFNSGDPKLLAHYLLLAADHLEVVAGDKAEPNLQLNQQTWQRLADTVDLIVDPAALVNHVLPYGQLFGPNVLGTAELIRIALTTKRKPFVYVSTIGVGTGIESSNFTEDRDIREISATRKVDDSYANGYSNSKWAGEVLLREAHDLYGLPVSVFRCDMILADTTYANQLNLPDMFTRMMLSLVCTGIAPDSFYQLDADGNRQRAHYDGLPVGFIAEAISTLGERLTDGFETYHVINPYDDGIGLDQFVDWLIDAGYPITRVGAYDAWLQRFETAIRALPERQRQASLLPLLHNYQRPEKPIRGSIASADRFRAAVQDAKIGRDNDIPHVTREVIVKYITDLQLLGQLKPPERDWTCRIRHKYTGRR